MVNISEMNTRSVREVATLRDSKTLIGIMDQIVKYSKMPRSVAEMHSSGAGEADPEYQLIVQANNIAADIDNEIGSKKKQLIN